MSNGSVIIESGELRQFAGQLDHFNSTLVSQMSALNSQFQRLGDTWKDPAYARFGEEFQQLLSNLQRFENATEEVIPQLLSLAERVDAVHGR